jgi:hypothetical protein
MFDMDKIVETGCLKKVRKSVEVSADCGSVTLVLKSSQIAFNSIKDFSIRGSIDENLTLDQAVADLISKIRGWGSRRGVVADAIYGQAASAFKGRSWSLNVNYPSDANLCLLLADYRDQFNRQNTDADIHFVVGKKTIYVLSKGDQGGEDDQCK